MKLNLIYILSIFCFYSSTVFSQHSRETCDLHLLSITDTPLISILDSITSFEKKCDYYNDSLFFTVNVRKINDTNDIYELYVASSNDINGTLDFDPVLGYFYYKNHLFLVYRNVSEKFFKQTETVKSFTYTKYDDSYQKGDTLILYYIIDDSFTNWVYWYVKDKFIFKDRSSSCN